jgi:ubiquitin-conjugating enzyme E2 M
VASLDFEESSADTDNPLDALRGGQRASYELQQGGALPHGCRLEQTPGVASQYIFTVDACEGPYAPATIPFWIKIFDEFPARDGVSIRCTRRIFHPNIDQDTGLVKIQQDLFAAELRFKDLLAALRQLVLNPTDSPVANHDAAMLLQTNAEDFRRVVRTSLGGGEYRGVRFDRVLDFSKKSTNSGYPSDLNQIRAPQMSDQTKLALMKIEVMQVQYKAYADDVMRRNTEESQTLERR